MAAHNAEQRAKERAARLAARLQQLARARGLNMSQLSRRADLGYTTVQGIWTGKVKSPTLDTLDALATALNVKVGDLTDDPDAPDAPERGNNELRRE